MYHPFFSLVNVCTGPGPGRYKLPACVGHSGHDPTRKTMPAFSFGKRLEDSSELICTMQVTLKFEAIRIASSNADKLILVATVH